MPIRFAGYRASVADTCDCGDYRSRRIGSFDLVGQDFHKPLLARPLRSATVQVGPADLPRQKSSTVASQSGCPQDAIQEELDRVDNLYRTRPFNAALTSLQINRVRFHAGLATPPSRSPRSRVLLSLPHRFRHSKPSQRINRGTALR